MHISLNPLDTVGEALHPAKPETWYTKDQNITQKQGETNLKKIKPVRNNFKTTAAFLIIIALKD